MIMDCVECWELREEYQRILVANQIGFVVRGGGALDQRIPLALSPSRSLEGHTLSDCGSLKSEAEAENL